MVIQTDGIIKMSTCAGLVAHDHAVSGGAAGKVAHAPLEGRKEART